MRIMSDGEKFHQVLCFSPVSKSTEKVRISIISGYNTPPSLHIWLVDYDGTEEETYTSTLAVEPETGTFMEDNRAVLDEFVSIFMQAGGCGLKTPITGSIVIPPDQGNDFLNMLSQERFHRTGWNHETEKKNVYFTTLLERLSSSYSKNYDEMKDSSEKPSLPEFCISHFVSENGNWMRALVYIGNIEAGSSIPGYENCETVEIVTESGTRETTRAYIRLFINGDPDEPWLHHIENESNPLSAELFIDWLGITPLNSSINRRMKVHAYQIEKNDGALIPLVDTTTRYCLANDIKPQTWTKYAYSGAINESREEDKPSYLDIQLQYLYELNPNSDYRPFGPNVRLCVKFARFEEPRQRWISSIHLVDESNQTIIHSVILGLIDIRALVVAIQTTFVKLYTGEMEMAPIYAVLVSRLYAQNSAVAVAKATAAARAMEKEKIEELPVQNSGKFGYEASIPQMVPQPQQEFEQAKIEQGIAMISLQTNPNESHYVTPKWRSLFQLDSMTDRLIRLMASHTV